MTGKDIRYMFHDELVFRNEHSNMVHFKIQTKFISRFKHFSLTI